MYATNESPGGQEEARLAVESHSIPALPFAALFSFSLCPPVFSNCSSWFLGYLAWGESLKHGTTGAFACLHLPLSSRARAMAAFCLSLELLQGPCAEQTQPQWVVLADLCRMNSPEILRESVPLSATVCHMCHKTCNILHTAVHKASAFQLYWATKNKGHHQCLGLLEWQGLCTAALQRKTKVKPQHCYQSA